MMRALVTGAAGFIGAHCCGRLLDEGVEVVGLDNFDPFYERRIKEEGLDGLRGRGGFRFVEGDIRDRIVVERELRGIDVVVHLAARAGVRPSIEQPVLYSSINIDGTVQLLESCRDLGVRRFVFGSSSSVYGDTTPPPFREDVAAVHPISPYAATKRAGELLCQVYYHLYEMRIASLRFFTVYGPRQRPDLAIHKFTRLMIAGETIRQFGDGESARDYTHVDDIVRGVLGAVRWAREDAPAHEVFNLGGSGTVTLGRLIELIAAALGVDARIERHPAQPGDVRQTCADIAKAQRILGYNPSVAIEDGIPAFVEWYRNYHGTQHPTAG
jgi:UDP-glucuronate 4-epimerase